MTIILIWVLLSSVVTHDQLIWVSDCLMFNAKQLCSYIMARASYVSMIWWWRHLSTLEWILFVLAHWNTSSRIDMSLHSSTLSFFLTPYGCMLNWERTHSNFTVISWTRPWPESTIYRTRSEHANHYTSIRFQLNTERDNIQFYPQSFYLRSQLKLTCCI